MPYVNTFDREKEIEILQRIAKQTTAIAGKRSGLARAHNNLKKARAELEGLKRELFICRFGEAALTARLNNALKARAALAKKREAEEKREALELEVFGPIGPGTVLPPQLPVTILPPVIGPVNSPLPDRVLQTLSITGPPTQSVSANINMCPRCNQRITPRGLCGCPGVRHRDVRVLKPGPQMNIKHPPVPAFQMGAEKE